MEPKRFAFVKFTLPLPQIVEMVFLLVEIWVVFVKLKLELEMVVGERCSYIRRSLTTRAFSARPGD